MQFMLPLSVLIGCCAVSGAEIGRGHRDLKILQKTDSVGAERLFKAIQEEDLKSIKSVVGTSSKEILEAALGDHNLIRPLHMAVIIGNQDIVEVLIQAGADPNSENSNGATPVHMASQLAEVEILLQLIKAGGDVNARTATSEETPLHIAAVHDTPAIIQILLEAGAEIDGLDAQGETPLHEAAAYGAELSVALLLEYGADAGKRDIKSRLPGDFVCFCLTYVDDPALLQCGEKQCSVNDIEVLEDLLEEVTSFAPEPESD
ncbi:hypothetical protein BSKO_01638 [Bryopsis sp. KO-2023]|nr:hypothetical protein BSKO_01638 [Bryopsis sp. KO-2023]